VWCKCSVYIQGWDNPSSVSQGLTVLDKVVSATREYCLLSFPEGREGGCGGRKKRGTGNEVGSLLLLY